MLKHHGILRADNAGRDKQTIAKYLKKVNGPLFQTDLHDVSKPYKDQVAISVYVPGAAGPHGGASGSDAGAPDENTEEL